MDNRLRTILLGAVLATGAVLRLWDYWSFSFSNDELSALSRLEFGSLASLVYEGVRPDGHPAAAQVLLWHVSRLFGEHEAVVRLPFVLAGIAAILFTYRMGRAWASVSMGLLMAASVATLEFPLLYSRIARPYSLGLLFATMAAYLWIRVLRNTHSAANLWVLAISLALCAYTHYFSGLTAAVMALAGTFILRGSNLRQYLYALGGAVVLFLPHLSITLHQLSLGGVGWVAIPGNHWPLEHLHHVFNRSYLVMGVLAAIGVVGWATFRPHRKWTQWLLPLLLFGLPLSIGFLYSVLVSPVLQHSVLLFSFPFILAFLFSGWDDSRPWLTSLAVTAVLIMGVFSTVKTNGFYRTEHFGVFRQLAEKASEWHGEHGGNLLMVADVNHPSYLDRYLQRTSTPDLRFDGYRTTDEGGLLRLKQLMSNSQADHLAYAWSTIDPSAEVERTIREKFPVEVDAEIHFNSGIRLFRKGNPDHRVVSNFNFENELPWQCVTSRVVSDSLLGKWYRLGGDVPFGPEFSARVSELPQNITVYVEGHLSPTDPEVLIIMEQWAGGERYVWESRPVHTQIAPGTSGWAVAEFGMKKPTAPSDILKIYCWSVTGHEFRLSDIEVRDAR